MEEEFLRALHERKKIKVTYFSKKDDQNVTRTCAPLDIALHAKYPDKGDYYFLWDYEGSRGPHQVPKKPEDIINIEITDEEFDPSEFITWETNWTISRDWGRYS